jgi:hypothetical protein
VESATDHLGADAASCPPILAKLTDYLESIMVVAGNLAAALPLPNPVVARRVAAREADEDLRDAPILGVDDCAAG